MFNELATIDQNIIALMTLLMFISIVVVTFELFKNIISSFIHSLFPVFANKITKWKEI